MGFFKDELIGVLYVDDFEANVAFYEDKLGLPRVHQWDYGPGRRGVKVAVAGGGFLEIVEHRPPAPQGPTSLWMEARDINGLYASLQKTPGMDLFEPIEDKYFHARSFQMRDPDGNATFVVAYEKDVKPYTADAIKGAYFKDEFRTVLFVEDLDLCYRYYTEVLELPCVYQWDEGPGDRGFKYKAAGSGAYIETLHRVPLTEQGAGTIKIEARDIDACYAALQKKPDANITKALAPTGWGTRQFELTDPDSNIILVFSRQ
ncbi:MAG: VOC family protein [Oscillospiraceae bacterium]|nr:VOC family protein [Oscillospiraceae bacterium]